MQHNDGTWSHKPGSTAVTNKSIDTNVTLTNANMSTRAIEGGYNNALRYFVIGKDAVTDYPHNNGQGSSTVRTTTDFRDKAGDTITQSYTITGNWNSRFDYSGDKDFFKFTPTSSKYYTITTDRGSGYDVDGVVYDSDGNQIASDYSTNNANFSVYLTAGKAYYIGMWDAKNNIDYYILWCY